MAEETRLGFESLAADVWEFVHRRVLAALSSLSDTCAAYLEAENEVELSRKELINRLDEDGDFLLAIDRFDSAKNCKFGVEADFIYWQGLVDGLRLSDEILKSEIGRWLVSGYPGGWRAEPGDEL